MKTIITLLIGISISATIFAQQGINYKALIKDGSGNVVANQNIMVQFNILRGVGLSNEYTETHTPSTDANGIIMVNIGEGTPDTGDYGTIDWGADDHYLNVQIDTGSGPVDMGTTQFMAVPYALNASNAENVTGLEALNEGNGIGWRLKGRAPANYGNIGENAVDLSYTFSASETFGATGNFSLAKGGNVIASGDYSTSIGAFTTASGNSSTAMGGNTIASGGSSTAMGSNSTASGIASTAMGSNTTASGLHSIAMGRNTSASGTISTAIGNNSSASGNSSIAMGEYTKADSFSSTAIGSYNVGGGNPTGWITTDKLFEIGNGTSNGNRNNALTVLKNGNVGIGIVAPSSKLQIVGGNVTVDGNIGIGTSTPNAKLQIAGTNGISLQITGANDVSPAGGTGAIVMGTTNGLNLALDNNEIMARSNGVASTLNLNIEGGTVATGGKIEVGGLANLNKGIASGVALQVNGSEALWYNGTYFSWGYGGSANYFADKIGIGVVDSPHALSVSGSIKLTDKLYFGEFSNIDLSSIYVLKTNSSFIPYQDGALKLGTSSNRWHSVYAVNGVYTSSDARLKTEINISKYGLEAVLQLNPVSYRLKADPDKNNKKLGLIAQDLFKIIPEVVKTHEMIIDENNPTNLIKKEASYLSVNYSELIPVLINAIQEQHLIIEAQKEKNRSLEARLSKVEQFLNTTQ